jgi:hypothetical protein
VATGAAAAFAASTFLDTGLALNAPGLATSRRHAQSKNARYIVVVGATY